MTWRRGFYTLVQRVGELSGIPKRDIMLVRIAMPSEAKAIADVITLSDGAVIEVLPPFAGG